MHKKCEVFLRQIRDRVDRFAVFFHGEVQIAAFFAVVFGWSGNVADDGAFGDGVAFGNVKVSKLAGSRFQAPW